MTAESPYKFLSSFGVEDRDKFFARDREIEVLLSDVLVSRIVVLFARTGTGKTSLINAGVRPRLMDLGYLTFYFRVEGDPRESAHRALEDEGLRVKKTGGLRELLATAAKQARHPLVLFFDQFEEFFLHTQKQEEIDRFVHDIAEVYLDADLQIHLVFSLRAEFFHEMEVFREAIPSIFQKGSSLRLRDLDCEQAKDAIEGPARDSGRKFDSRLVGILLKDLEDHGRIEPTHLQIVCDTLWRESEGSTILVNDYRRLGGAVSIIDHRLQQDIERTFSDPTELGLLREMMPEFCTERGTKRIRGIEELDACYPEQQALLARVLEKLGDLGLLRTTVRGGENYVEWSSDYLAQEERLESLKRGVELSRVKLKLKQAEKDHRDTRQLIPPRLLADLKDHLDDLKLSRRQSKLLFESALARNLDVPFWYEVAEQKGVATWKIVEGLVTGQKGMERLTALELLPKIRSRNAVRLLKESLSDQALAPTALRGLVELDTVPAVQAVAPLLEERDLLPFARSALAAFKSSKRDAVVNEAQRIEERTQEVESPPEPAGETPLDHRPYTTRIRPLLIAQLMRGLLKGQVTPFLGPGINAGLGEITAPELAKNLADHYSYSYPNRDLLSLTQVGQYVALVAGEQVLDRHLYSLLKMEKEPGDVHRFFARIARHVEGRLLIVSLNLDNLLETAFRQENQPFHLIAYIAKSPGLEFRYAGPSDSGSRILPSQDQGWYALSEDQHPVILKLGGTVESPLSDGFVLTEDDCLELFSSGWQRSDPARVFRLPSRGFLFLGIEISDWSSRGLVYSLLGKHGLQRGPSWAVAPGGKLLDVEYWRALGVHYTSTDIARYLQGLKKSLEETEPDLRHL